MTAWPGAARSQSVRLLSPEAVASTQSDEPSLLPKTLIFVSVAMLTDLAVGYIVSGGLVTGTAIAVVNSASGWVLYHVHETVWADVSPANPPEGLAITKTATFTLANSVRLLGIGFLFTGNVATSAGFLVLNALGDAGAYVVTDRIWAYLPARRMMMAE